MDDEVTPLQSPVWVDGVTPLNSVNMTQLQTRDEKQAPSGYVGLDASRGAIIPGVLNAQAGVSFGAPGAAVNMYATAASTLNVDGFLFATAAAAGAALGMRRTGDTGWRSYLDSDGKHWWGDAGGTYDTNLYRSAAGQLKTDGVFFAGGAIASGVGTAGQIQITSGVSPSVIFGPAGDTNLYRAAAGTLKTDGAFQTGVGGNVSPGGHLIIDPNLGGYKILFSNSADTNLYRLGSGILKTDGRLDVATRMTIGIDNVSKLWFGSNDDTNLYRSAAAALATSGEMSFGGRLIVNSAQPSTNWVLVGQQGGGLGLPAITFGTDTPLYRSSAGVLKLDGTFNATVGLQINGVPISGGGTRGQNTVTFSGAPTSAQVTFAHGLGVTPTNIQLTSKSGIGYCLLYVVSADATNITVEGRDSADAARTGTNGFYWMASA